MIITHCQVEVSYLIYLISFWDWDNLACRGFPILILENPWQMSRLALYANEKRAREAGLPFQLLLLLSKTVTHQSKTRSKQQLCHRTWAPEGRRGADQRQRRTIEKERNRAGWRSWNDVRVVAPDRSEWKESVEARCANWHEAVRW